MYIQLTEKTKNICSINYDKKCGICPLRPVCCEKFPNIKDALNNYTKRLNKLAETIKSGTQY